ncbi:MAG: hypothetical protein EZS28_019908 [Streblomastix strix]|uniref:Uncharacterized protein n=1 Tax=Streblomastix strix TaxID=222440 RepID=A0A5J4VPZ5_9EUKA|nr:MAG: hypothetical protein EZS28_019908 [Streblomastix strix]
MDHTLSFFRRLFRFAGRRQLISSTSLRFCTFVARSSMFSMPSKIFAMLFEFFKKLLSPWFDYDFTTGMGHWKPAQDEGV